MPKSLGSTTDYPEKYAPEILEGIPRQSSRQGVDIWTCYEVSWCCPSGLPKVAIAQMTVPASSSNIVESKSLKLYLNSFNNEVLAQDEFESRWRHDLQQCIGADIQLKFYTPEEWSAVSCSNPSGTSLDAVTPDKTKPWVEDNQVHTQSYYTHLFRSLCPVTSQPDWATLVLNITGKQVNPQRLIYELTHDRNKQGFHESCVDGVFDMLQEHLACDDLSVIGYFTRRGGIDITPIRTTKSQLPEWKRQFRQ
jgi:7-cyano-7-deazaguanine reductase